MPALPTSLIQLADVIALAKSFWHYHRMFRWHSTTRVFFAILTLSAATLPAAFAKKKPPAHPININTANSSDLQQVPGIGPSTAQKILDTRKSYGAFKSVDDLLSIKGIGPKRLEKMRKYLTVGKFPSKKQSASQAVSTPTKPPPTKKSSPPATASEDEEP